MCDCKTNAPDVGYATTANQANGYGLAEKAEAGKSYAIHEDRYSIEKRAVRSFKETELRHKFADLKRFIKDSLPHDEASVAVFKLEEAELWANKGTQK